MSTCVDRNYPEWFPNPNPKHSGDNSHIYPFPSPPHNPIEGSMYLDTTLNEVKIYVGGEWKSVQGNIDETVSILDEFELIIPGEEFIIVQITEYFKQKDIRIFNQNEEEIVSGIENCINYIKENLDSQYANLVVEKRILQHLG